ncbi:hypothetical protein FB567DRAFT_611965 [Paraphoma chrysanthemicola]|uniref:Uncharacterized protein n=1 Tax=Paraphoma chrysanthemicola TaxID=798071 RepID=A0A8K0QUQ1_9PLEO|nr:hypothetical protein FB567DRAFT_611965 [Paraphoma chrysanthemicola]
MPEPQLLAWLEKVDPKIRSVLVDDKGRLLDHKRNIARYWLQRMFSGMFHDMEKETPLSIASVKTLDKWRKQMGSASGLLVSPNKTNMMAFLKETVPTWHEIKEPCIVDGEQGCTTRKIILPDYRNDASFWPRYYKNWLLARGEGGAHQVGQGEGERDGEGDDDGEGSCEKKGEVDFATLSEADLRVFCSLEIVEHKSINKSRKKSSTTLRALLFVRQGNSFKDESAERCKKIWIRDTNVFTEGEDFVFGADGEPEILRSDLDEMQIRTRMRLAYEAVDVEFVEDKTQPRQGKPEK